MEEQERASETGLQGRVQDRAASVAVGHEASMAELHGRLGVMGEQVTKQEAIAEHKAEKVERVDEQLQSIVCDSSKGLDGEVRPRGTVT